MQIVQVLLTGLVFFFAIYLAYEKRKEASPFRTMVLGRSYVYPTEEVTALVVNKVWNSDGGYKTVYDVNGKDVVLPFTRYDEQGQVGQLIQIAADNAIVYIDPLHFCKRTSLPSLITKDAGRYSKRANALLYIAYALLPLSFLMSAVVPWLPIFVSLACVFVILSTQPLMNWKNNAFCCIITNGKHKSDAQDVSPKRPLGYDYWSPERKMLHELDAKVHEESVASNDSEELVYEQSIGCPDVSCKSADVADDMQDTLAIIKGTIDSPYSAQTISDTNKASSAETSFEQTVPEPTENSEEHRKSTPSRQKKKAKRRRRPAEKVSDTEKLVNALENNS